MIRTMRIAAREVSVLQYVGNCRAAAHLHSSTRLSKEDDEEKAADRDVVGWMNKMMISTSKAKQTLIGEDPSPPKVRTRDEMQALHSRVMQKDAKVDGMLTDMQTQTFYDNYREWSTQGRSEQDITAALSNEYKLSQFDTAIMMKYYCSPLFKQTAKGIDIGVHSDTSLTFP